MGMDLYTNTSVITSEEFKKFKDGEFYINKYDLTLLSKDEIEKTKKVFFFDFLSTIIENNSPEEVDEIFDTYRIAETEKEKINLYTFLEENFISIMDDYIIDKYRDDLYYDEDIFECYINYNDWIEGNDLHDGYLNRDWVEVGDSVVLIQSRFE
jgi:hypothetical protein